MVTVTWWEILGLVVIAAVLGILLWDFVWTVIVPDPKSRVHFGKASAKRRLVWISITVLVVVAIVGWLY